MARRSLSNGNIGTFFKKFIRRKNRKGFSISDLDLLTAGLVIDMWTEKANDGAKYEEVAREAVQADFDAFPIGRQSLTQTVHVCRAGAGSEGFCFRE